MDCARRGRFGTLVRSALIGRNDVEHVEGCGFELFLVFDFLSEAECQSFAQAIDDWATPSTLYEGTQQAGFRTSSTCHFSGRESLVTNVDLRLSELLSLDVELGEPLQGQRYQPGQQFKAHNDYFHENTSYWEFERVAGQRTWTAMAYLNEPEGGDTRFPAAGLSIAPTAGMLVVWNNMDHHGQPNPLSLHAGMPVMAGTKYVLTKWYRELPFSLRTQRMLELQSQGALPNLVA